MPVGRIVPGFTTPVELIEQTRAGRLFSTEWEKSAAVFSPCMKYRYMLLREWNSFLPCLVVIGLNPSTADQDVNDPTITRLEKRARALKYGGLTMLNLFALRATDPGVMLTSDDPVGEANDEAIMHYTREHDVLCGWGVHGVHRGRDDQVMSMLKDKCRTLCLGTTKDGAPRHPLYVSYVVALQEFVA